MHNPPNIISVITVYNEKCFFFKKGDMGTAKITDGQLCNLIMSHFHVVFVILKVETLKSISYLFWLSLSLLSIIVRSIFLRTAIQFHEALEMLLTNHTILLFVAANHSPQSAPIHNY